MHLVLLFERGRNVEIGKGSLFQRMKYMLTAPVTAYNTQLVRVFWEKNAFCLEIFVIPGYN